MDQLNEVLEVLRASFPIYVVIFLPLVILISPISPVNASHEFSVYRMQHYDLQGVSHGCRASFINVEARVLESKSYVRKCVIVHLTDLTIEKYREMMKQAAAAVLVLLPSNITSLTEAEKKHVQYIEHELMQEETNVPVYFTHETQEVSEMYDKIHESANTDHAASATEALFSSVTANGYQLVVSTSQAQAMSNAQIASISGKLSGFGAEEQVPTIAIITHYDAFSVAPALSFGADSNGSGVAALLEIARLFSRLFSCSRTHPRFNLLFLLSGGGKFNFQGTKKWIEDNIDGSENSLLQDVQFAVCLDSLGSGNELNVHVSKPPKPGTSSYTFHKELERVAQSNFPEMKINVVHKKINLADEFLSWEHERFSIRRLPAFSLSHFEDHSNPSRSSVLDIRDKLSMDSLSRNVKVIAEALGRQLYNLSAPDKSEIFTDSFSVSQEHLTAWMDYMTSQPRGAQMLSNKNNPLIYTLEQAMSRTLKEVKVHYMKPDKRDPEFVFYDNLETKINAHFVKPAVFDLFLSAAIGLYLVIIYLFVNNFHKVVEIMVPLSGFVKEKSN